LAITVGSWVPRFGERLAVKGIELRLGIEGIDVRNASVHEAENDSLGPRQKMRTGRRHRRAHRLLHHSGQRDQPKAIGGRGERLPPG
jgi:hypothetical protein